MAREAITVIGTVVGAYFGNPQLGYAIGSLIGNAVDPQVIRGPRLQEIPTQTASEGGHRSVVYGTSLINRCNIIDFGDVDPEYYEEEQGKGGPVVERERLRRTFAIGLGEPITAISMIRMDGKIVYDVRPGSTMLAASAKFLERFRFYNGSEDQLPDPDLEALPHNGVGNTPAYRGTSYLVFPRYDLTDQQGRIPTFEVEANRQSTVRTFDSFLRAVPDGTTGIRQAILSSPDGRDWSGPFVAETSNPADPLYSAGFRMGAIRDRLLCWNEAGSPASVYYSDDLGETWALGFSAVTATGLGAFGCQIQERFAISGPSRRMYTTADGVTLVDSGINPALVAAFSPGSSHAFATGAVGVVYETINSGLTWSATLGTDPLLTSPGCAGGDGTYCYFGGRSNVGSTPKLYRTEDGITFEDVALPAFASATKVTAFAYGEGVWVIGTDSGEIAYDIGDGFVLSSDTMPAECRALIWNGQTFTMLSDPGGSGTTAAAVKWSDDGQSWTSATLPESLYSVSMVTMSGVVIDPGEAIPTDLRTIVADICDRCGIPAGKLDLEVLTDEIYGITLGGPYDGAGAIASLMPAYLFDLFEADKKLHAVKRGAAVVTTITEDDLIEEPDEGALRGQDIEYPRELMFKYYNPAQNYAAPAAVVSRTTPDIRVRGQASIELPIAMTETEALNIANRMFKVMWEDLNGEVVLSVPLARFPSLTATDNLGLLLRGQLYRIRAEKIEEQGRVLKITARRDRQSAYTSNLTAIPLPAPTPPPPSLAGETVFAVLNIPGIIDSDDQLGLRFAICGQPGTAWRGARIDYSVDAGANWTILGTYTQSARMGVLIDPLPGAPAEFVDTTHTLRVALVDDRMLESVTDVQLLQEGNGAAIVRADGTAELIQFRDATDDGNREWSLDYLLRGRLLTDPSGHDAEAQFVMLSGSFFVPMPSALIGRDLLFRVISVGNSPEDAPTYPFTWSPAHSQTEFPVALLEVDRAGGLVSASWSPRPRFGTEISPIHSVNFEGYRLLFEAGGYAEFHDTTATTYATSDAPFTGPITVTVYGLNRITGQGPGTSETTST